MIHALRIKGLSAVEPLAEVADVRLDIAARHLDQLLEAGLARFVPARSLWQLTPAGREHHPRLLPGADERALATLQEVYRTFLELNTGLPRVWLTRWVESFQAA